MYFDILPDNAIMYQYYSTVDWSNAVTVNLRNNGISTAFVATPTAHL